MSEIPCDLARSFLCQLFLLLRLGYSSYLYVLVSFVFFFNMCLYLVYGSVCVTLLLFVSDIILFVSDLVVYGRDLNC